MTVNTHNLILFRWCCGVGGCNIFCCNCDYGCRQGPYSLQNLLPLANRITADDIAVAIERFNNFDTDQSGAIDINELKQAVTVGMPAYFLELEFGKMDINRDGKITIEEFDEDAGISINLKEKLQ